MRIERFGDGDSQASQLANGQELAVRRPISDHQAGRELLAKMLTDRKKNYVSAQPEREIQNGKSILKIFVIPTNEEFAIAGATYQLGIIGRKPA